MYGKPLYLASGVTSVITADGLIQFLARLDWQSFLGFLGSASVMALGWYISRRQELRQAAREEQLADLVQAMKIREILDKGRDVLAAEVVKLAADNVQSEQPKS